MPQVIVIDEIGTELEAQAARTIAERGVQLIGTAHGNNLDNLMLNPTLSDLIGGIQSVTLGDEEARRRRTQKSVLERKAPPTFDVIIEIQDRERVTVHGDVADTVDAMLRGDPVAPELRWRDEEGVHRSQARPRPSPREQIGAERFAGLVGSGQPWRMEPGWRGEGAYRCGGYRDAGRRPRRAGPLRVSAWRERRLAPDAGRIRARAGAARPAETRGPGRRPTGTMPGERFAIPPAAAGAAAPRRRCRRSSAARSPIAARSSAAPRRRPTPRAREARELERQKAWRDQAAPRADRAQGRGRDRARSTPTTSSRRRGRRPARDRGGRARRGGPRPRAARRCRRSASCPRGSAGSGWSRRSATSSCRSRSPATSTRPTS